MSIFDVSDPSDPTRIDQITLDEGSSSEIEYDHHAFLYWEPSGLVMVPVQQWWWDENSESAFFGAIGLAVEEDGHLSEVRRISHPDACGPPPAFAEKNKPQDRTCSKIRPGGDIQFDGHRAAGRSRSASNI